MIKSGLARMVRGLAVAGGLAGLIGFGVVPAAAAAPVRHVVVFLVDDLGWRDVGCYGSGFYRTPHADALARSGARFTDAYAACAVCSPTRAAILTGKYPARLMLTDWLPSGRWNPHAKLRSARFVRSLPLEEETLAEALRAGGYETVHIGKWHLGGPPFSLPEHHGFDVNIGGNAHGAPGSYFHPYAGDWAIPTTGLRTTWNVFEDGVPGEYLTDRLTDEAVRFIRQPHEKPFFLHLAQYGVHTPLQAKPEMVGPYEAVPEADRQGTPAYAAMVESVDESLGRILAALAEQGLADETLVIFTSDNGGFAGATSNAPLRANKGAAYEGGIRVPLIIRWPGVAAPGSVIGEPVTSTDIYPTCLAATGLPARPAQHVDGMSLEPLLRGTGFPPRSALYWHFPHYNEHPSSVPASAIRKGAWKLIESFDPPGLELYDLANDIGESRDLAAEKPEVVAELAADLAAWRAETGAQMMQPNPDYDPIKAAEGGGKKKKKRLLRMEGVE